MSKLFLLVTAFTIFSGCANTELKTDLKTDQARISNLVSAKPLVVATSTVICDLTKQIAAETINLKCLLEAGTDPHVFKATPADIQAIASAKLVLFNGYEFESTLIKAIKADTNSAPKIAVAEVAIPNPIMAIEQNQLEPDPHIWHNALNGIKMTEVITKELEAIQPDKTSLYQQNSKRLTAEIAAIDAWIKIQIATIPPAQRKLVTTHDALGYYVKAYGIPPEAALQSINTEEKATPTRIKDLISIIKTSKVPTIFAEVSINPKLIETVAREANVKISDQPLFTDGLGVLGSYGDTYQKMLVVNTKAIVQGLGGKYEDLESFKKNSKKKF